MKPITKLLLLIPVVFAVGIMSVMFFQVYSVAHTVALEENLGIIHGGDGAKNTVMLTENLGLDDGT